MAAHQKLAVIVRVKGGEQASPSAWSVHGNTIVQTDAKTSSADAEGDSFQGEFTKMRSLSGVERSFRDQDKLTDLHRGIKSSHAMMSFTFDEVYGQAASTADIVESKYVQNAVKGACEGFNGCVLAYGQTGSGKTHTVIGSPDDPGLFPLALMEVFRAISNDSRRQYLIQMSYFDIYNDEVYDLLGSDDDGRDMKNTNRIVDHPSLGATILGMTLVPVSKPEDAVEQLLGGDVKRRQYKGAPNTSATHEVLQLRIESRLRGTDSAEAAGDDSLSSRSNDQFSSSTPAATTSSSHSTHDALKTTSVANLSLIALAGSEKMSPRPGERPRVIPSLLALGNVIAKLSEKSRGKANVHVPYRDSKLTRLLSSSLGGNARTCAICHIIPGQSEVSNSMNTMRFASRCMNVVNVVKRNSVRSARSEIDRFKREITKLKKQLSSIQLEGQERQLQGDRRQTEMENNHLRQRLASMQGSLLDSNSPSAQEVGASDRQAQAEDVAGGGAQQQQKPKSMKYRRKSIMFSSENLLGGYDERQQASAGEDAATMQKGAQSRRPRGRRLSMSMNGAMQRYSMEAAKTKQVARAEQAMPPNSSSSSPSSSASYSAMDRADSAVWSFSNADVDRSDGAGVFSTSRSPFSSALGGATAAARQAAMPNSVAVKMLRSEMDAQMKTILGLKDKISHHEEKMFEEQAKNYELAEAVRHEKNARKEVEDTCAQLQDMLKSVRGHFEDSEEKSSQRQNRVSKIVEETRKQVRDKDEEIASLKSALKDEMEKRSALEEAKTKAFAKQELADFYFGELVQRTNERESMERALMSAEERRERESTAVRVQNETWGEMERSGHQLKASLDATRSELRAAKLQNLTSKRDVSALEEALVEARQIAGRMEAFSAHLTQEMEGKRRGESGYFRHGDGPTATTKLIKALAEKSRAKVTRLMRTPMNMVGGRGSPLGGGSAVLGGNSGLLLEKGFEGGEGQRQAGLIRELTEKLRDSEFRVASLELAREMDTQQRTRLENIVEDLQAGLKGLQLERISVWRGTQNQQSLSSLALRELDALRRELSAIGSRDADRMAQVKEMEYVSGALETMGEDQSLGGSKHDQAGLVRGLGRKKESNLGKDVAFFKPLVREELAYTVDELVLLNERLHFVESQVLGRAIEVGDRIGAPTRWQHPSPLRVKPVTKGHLDGSKSKSTWR